MFGLSKNGQDAMPDEKRRQMVFVIVGGLAVLAVLGVVFLFPMLSGGGSDDASAAPVVQRQVKPKATPSATASASALPPSTLDPRAGSTRDPFAKLPQEAAAATTTGAGTAAGSSTTTDGTTTSAPSGGSSSGTTATTGSTATTASTGSTTTSSAPTTTNAATGTTPATGTTTSTSGSSTTAPGRTSSQVAGKPVQYMSFAGGGSATVEIDSAPYTVSAGQIVAGYRIGSVTSGSVQVAHGSVTKTLVLGELQTF